MEERSRHRPSWPGAAVDGPCPLVLHEACEGRARVIMVTSSLSEMKARASWRACLPTVQPAPARTLLIDADLEDPRGRGREVIAR